jgi:MFS family permease
VSIARYRTVLRLPGVARLLAVAVFARIPQTAAGMVLTLYVVGQLDQGYGAAGLVATAATVGMAASGPWRGRAIDRYGLRRSLVPSVIGSAVSWSAAPFVGYGPLIVVAFAGGVLGVPTFGIVRQSLSVLVPVEQRRTAFALDSIGVELSFMVGPAAGVLIATQLSAMTALLTVGAGWVLSALALMLLNPPTRSAAAPVPPTGPVEPGSVERGSVERGSVEPGRGPRWYNPELVVVLTAALSAGLVLAGTDVGLVAELREAGALSRTGLVFLAWSGGSVIGGAIYGGMHRSVSPTVLLLGLALLTVPVGLAPSPVLLAVTILPAAALCAPLISSTAEAVSRLVPEHARGQAMGWHGSALTIGSALGAPLAGAAIDAIAPWSGFAAVGTVGGMLGALGLVLRRGRRRPRAAEGGSPAVAAGRPAVAAGHPGAGGRHPAVAAGHPGAGGRHPGATTVVHSVASPPGSLGD